MEANFSKNFIEKVLINQVGTLVQNNMDHFALIIMGQGVEALGSFFDDKPFDYYERGLPKKRFQKGLSLFDKKYHKFTDILWEDLRCGLAHQLRPKNKLSISKCNDEERRFIVHLSTGDKSGFLYVIVTEFYKDFKVACEKVITKIDDPNNIEIIESKKKMKMLSTGTTQLEVNPKTGEIKEIFIKMKNI